MTMKPATSGLTALLVFWASTIVITNTDAFAPSSFRAGLLRAKHANSRRYYKDETPNNNNIQPMVESSSVDDDDPFDNKNLTVLADMVQHHTHHMHDDGHHRVYKIVPPHADHAELWFDAEAGRFYEACHDAEDIPLASLFERTVDTVEDVIAHARRVPYEKGWVSASKSDQDERPTVVVLGSGWASHALIKVADTSKMRILVVSPVNHFVFTPSKSMHYLCNYQNILFFLGLNKLRCLSMTHIG